MKVVTGLCPCVIPLAFLGLLLGNGSFRADPLFHALPSPDSSPLMGVIWCNQRGFQCLSFMWKESNFRTEGMN